MNAMVTGRSSRTMRRTSSSIARRSSSVSAAVEREVEAQVVRRHERAGLAGALARRRCAAPGGAGACRCGCASCGRGARRRPRPRRVSPTRSRPWSVPRWTIRPAGRLAGCPSTVEQRRSRRPARAGRPGRRPGRRPRRRTGVRSRTTSACAAGRSSSLELRSPSRRIATTRPSARRRLVAEERRCRRRAPGSRS